MTQLNQFAAYVKSFYGPGEMYGNQFDNSLTDFEIGLAIGLYLEGLRHVSDLTYGGGDSVDRELVRDILIRLRKIA